jgi:hypothetical protein
VAEALEELVIHPVLLADLQEFLVRMDIFVYMYILIMLQQGDTYNKHVNGITISHAVILDYVSELINMLF